MRNGYMRSFFSIAALVIVLAYHYSLFIQGGEFADDPGVGWHLKTGQQILETLKVPYLDPFLAPTIVPALGLEPGQQRLWVCDQWLADLILFVSKRVGGYPLVYALCAAIYLISFFGVVGGITRESSRSALCALAVTVLAFKLSEIHFILRPVLFSILFFTLTYRRIRAVATLGAGELREFGYTAVYLCVIFILWANMHPAFVEGLLLLALAVPVLAFDKRSSRRRVTEMCALLAVCAVATLCNPRGIELHRSIFALAGDRYLLGLNQEWKPLLERGDFVGFFGVLFTILCVLPVLLAVWMRSRMATGWVLDLVATIVFGVQAFLMVRCVPFVAITAAPLAARVYSELLGFQLPGVFNLSQRCFTAVDKREGKTLSWGSIALVCAVVGIAATWVAPGMVVQEALGPSTKKYDQAIVSAIRNDAPRGVVYATPNLGGFLTASLYPDFRAVIDDRNTLIGAELYRRYFRSMESLQELQSIITAFGVTHLILEKDRAVMREARESGVCTILLESEQWSVCRVN